jgi:hypothetical protein
MESLLQHSKTIGGSWQNDKWVGNKKKFATMFYFQFCVCVVFFLRRTYSLENPER